VDSEIGTPAFSYYFSIELAGIWAVEGAKRLEQD
jgi:hypothetical protein